MNRVNELEELEEEMVQAKYSGDKELHEKKKTDYAKRLD